MKHHQERRACENERGPHNQGTDDSPEQNPMVKPWRHGKIRKEQNKNKDVVHTEGILDEVAGEELQPFGWTEFVVNERAKRERKNDPDDAPQKSLAETDDVRLAVKHPKIERQEKEDNYQKS
jgi:hypothetical protein